MYFAQCFVSWITTHNVQVKFQTKQTRVINSKNPATEDGDEQAVQTCKLSRNEKRFATREH